MSKINLPTWDKRSIFTANLYNPAFLGIILQKTIYAFQEKKKEEFPFTLVHFILPLIFYSDSRYLIPKKGGHNGAWLDKNGYLKEVFDKRFMQFMPFTKETLIFLSRQDSITFSDEGTIQLTSSAINNYDYQEDSTIEYFIAAENLGRWLTYNSPKNIYLLFGIKP